MSPKNPNVPVEVLVDAFHRMQVQHARVVQHVAVQHDVNPTDLRVLKFLGVADVPRVTSSEASSPDSDEADGGPAHVRVTPTPTAVGAYLEMSLGAVTALLKRLEKRGLLERSRNPNDRRGSLLALTPAGHDVVDQLRASYASAIERSVPPALQSAFLRGCLSLEEELDRSVTADLANG